MLRKSGSTLTCILEHGLHTTCLHHMHVLTSHILACLHAIYMYIHIGYIVMHTIVL